MIRGPVLPQLRESLWALVANHLDSIETGLVLAMKDLDCSDGQLGPIDGLARDASGAPVLVLLAVEADALLAARVLGALEFLERVGDSLATAIPEGSFRAGAVGRVIVVSTGTACPSLESLLRLDLDGVDLCRLEPFRIAGTERFAVRWLRRKPAGVALAAAEFRVEPAQKAHWESILRLCERLDAGVGIDGDRFWRRITWQGRVLGQIVAAEGVLQAIDGDGTRRSLLTSADVREFCDLLVRRYATFAGLGLATGGATAAAQNGRDEGSGALGRAAARPAVGDSLRSSLAAARLSPEEYSALGGPARASVVAVTSEVADDMARIVAAQEGSWASPPQRSD